MISDYFAHLILNGKLRATGDTAIASVWLALLTAMPLRGTATPGSEVAVAGGYARKQITFGTAAAAQRILNTAVVQFDPPTTDWAASPTPIVAYAIMDASASGNWLLATPICARYVLAYSTPPKFEIGSIKVGFDGLGCC